MKTSRIISLLLIAVLAGSLLAGCGSKNAVAGGADVSASDGLTYPDESDLSQAGSGSSSNVGAAVATCGSLTMDNRLLNYYYWLVFASYYSNYSSYISTDTPLAEQYAYEDRTWKDILVGNAISAWTSIAYYLQDAKADGYVLTGDYADSLSSLKESVTKRPIRWLYPTSRHIPAENYGEGGRPCISLLQF
jgi:hypothetical protein